MKRGYLYFFIFSYFFLLLACHKDVKPSEIKSEFAISDVYVDSICNPDTASFHIAYSCYLPNTFTPNHDGVNDYFFPKMTGITEYEFKIYNASETLIYQTSDHAAIGWDGMVNNKLAPIGVYHFTLRTHEKCRDKTHDYNGICYLHF